MQAYFSTLGRGEPRWPLQIPPSVARSNSPRATTGTVGLLRGLRPLCKTVGSFFEPIAPAAELDEYAAVHEAVQDGCGQRGVAEKLVPILDDAGGRNQGT